VYGERSAIRDGIIPNWVVDGAPGLRSAGVLARFQPVRAHVAGMDLVHDGDGGWFVLEDNLRVPSGIGYAVQNRRLSESVMPELPRPAEVLAVDGVIRTLRETLEAAAPPAAADRGPSIVLLSSGPGDAAWFEHRMLAEEMGVPVVQSTELMVVDGQVVMLRDGIRRRVDVLYLRIDEDTLLHATGGDGRPLGAALLGAVDQGTLALANAPGNGVADDKGVFAFVPEMIRYYLGEEPVLRQVPTYRCARPDARAHVLANLERTVVKRTDLCAGKSVVIGRAAAPDELEATADAIRADPSRYVAQPLVELSTAPTWTETGVEPRRVDLRPFVLFDGGEPWVLPGGLTRVTPHRDAYLVNLSQGGGAKDTWVLDGGPTEGAGDG